MWTVISQPIMQCFLVAWFPIKFKFNLKTIGSFSLHFWEIFWNVNLKFSEKHVIDWFLHVCKFLIESNFSLFHGHKTWLRGPDPFFEKVLHVKVLSLYQFTIQMFFENIFQIQLIPSNLHKLGQEVLQILGFCKFLDIALFPFLNLTMQ